jgi:uncharacterized protein (TIGR03437 family)
VAGGTSNGASTGTIELFNPDTGQFQAVGALNTARAEFAMTAVGRNLVIAGGTDGTNTLSSVEVYDGSLGTLTVAGAMSQARKDFAAAALLDGTILMTGGIDANGVTVASTEIFDPVRGTATSGPSLLTPRAFHSAYAMPHNGSVLIYGGAGETGILGATELYTPWTGGIVQGSPLNNARRDEAKAALSAGSYMIAGGRNDLSFLSGSELFRFSTITTDKSDYAPGTAVKISGDGWVPGEQVLVTLTAFPIDQHHIEFTGAAVADGAGNISVSGFAVDKSHLGMKFLMSAIGSQSQAQATFTDGTIDPIISYSFNPATTTPGTPVTVTVTLTPPSPSDQTPTGSFFPCTAGACPTTLSVSGASCNSTPQCTLSGGGAGNTATASFNITFPAGTTTFSVEYSGDGNYKFEIPGADAPVVNYTSQNFTVTDLTGGPASPATFGTQTPYVAHVCIAATSGGACLGSGTLSGKVQFLVNGVASGSPVSIVPTGSNTGTGTASFIPNPPLAAGGPYVITATYGNDLGNGNSNSTAANGGAASISTTIIKIDPTISYAFNPASGSGTSGNPVTVTVTLTPPSPANPTPTGTIIPCSPVLGCPTTLTVTGASCNSTPQCTLSAGAGNTAVVSFQITFPAGTTTFSVDYSGDSAYNFELPTSGATPPGAPVVNYTAQGFTVTDLTGGPASPANFGTQTPYVANVCIAATSGGACLGSGTLSGKVQFLVNGVASGSPISIVPTGSTTGRGTASFIPNPSLAVGGPYVITATYGNDLSNAGSNSTIANGGAASISTTIIPASAATSTVLTATSDNSPNPNIPLPTEIGRRITLTAVVTNTTSGSTVQPKASAITITPPAGNSSNSTCATPAPVSTTATSATVSCTFVLTGPFPANTQPTVTANAAYAGDTTLGTSPSTAMALAIPVVKATTLISTVVSAAPDSVNAVQLGRVVTITATAATLTNSSGVEVGPSGTFTFTLPANTYLNPSCGSKSGNTFTVTPTAANIAVTIPYSSAGGNQGTVTVSCTFTVVPPSAAAPTGLNTYTVTYNGDGLTQASPATATVITTVVDGTSMAACVLTSGGMCNASGNVYSYGQTISFAGTLSSNTTLPADGAAYQPTASVPFSGSGLNFVTPIVPTTTGGTASWTVPFLPTATGVYTVNVNYPTAQADPYYGASSAQVTFTVNKAATKTAIQPLSVSAGVPNLQVIVYNSSILGGGTPTGTVQVTNGLSSATGTLAPSSSCNGLAPLCAVVTLLVPTGSNYVASYPGDSNFLGSSSPPSGSVTNGSGSNSTPADSSLTITFSQNPPPVNQAITISVNVLGTNGGPSSPTGTVTLSDNGAVIGVNPVVASIATFNVTLGPGSHTLSAVYSGDSIFPSSTASYGITVVKPAPSTTFSASASASVFGQPVALSAALKGAAGPQTPTGTVQFLSNGAPLGSPVTLVNGAATLTTSSLPAGANLISVQYSGDGNFSSSTVNGRPVTVSQAQVTVTLGKPTTSNGQMTLTATLSVVAPGAGTPTGTVAFKDATTGATLGTANVSGGTATATVPATGDPIVAAYSGDTNFLGASSASTAPAATITALNAASGVAAFSADTIISIYGSGLTSQTLSGMLPLQSSLGGIAVTVTDSAGVPRQALLFFVSPGQINLLIPAGTATGPATITVNTGSGSLTTTINIGSSTAALFSANNSGSGPLAAQVVAVAPGGQQTYTNTAGLSGTTFVNAPISLSPAADIFYLLLYGTGFDTAKSVTVTINGQTYTPSYFGPQGGFAGLDQVNVLLPASLAGSGQVNVSITVDGQTSNVGSIAFGVGGTN